MLSIKDQIKHGNRVVIKMYVVESLELVVFIMYIFYFVVTFILTSQQVLLMYFCVKTNTLTAPHQICKPPQMAPHSLRFTFTSWSPTRTPIYPVPPHHEPPSSK